MEHAKTGKRLFKAVIVVLALLCLAVVAIQQAVDSSYIKSEVGDINIAPEGNLVFNVTEIQMKTPDDGWACCGLNATGDWSCTAGECS